MLHIVCSFTDVEFYEVSNLIEWKVYSYKLTAIEAFYRSMRRLGVSIATFDHKYNEVYSHVIFDTSLTEWKLIFIKHITGDVLELPVARGYRLEIRSFEDYKSFRKYFAIGGKQGEFKFSDFMPHLNKQIPDAYVLDDAKRKTVISYNKIDKKTSGIYPIGTINWTEVHIKHPQLDPDKHHRTVENLNKTRELYPDIYRATKGMDVSIKYGDKPNEKTESIKECSYDWGTFDESDRAVISAIKETD